MDRLTISSDSDSSTPDIFWDQLCGLVVKQRVPLERMLQLVTVNTAKALKLGRKGRLRKGFDGDVVVLEKGTLRIRDVIARGRRLIADGEPVVRERFLSKSKRNFVLQGQDHPAAAGD